MLLSVKSRLVSCVGSLVLSSYQYLGQILCPFALCRAAFGRFGLQVAVTLVSKPAFCSWQQMQGPVQLLALSAASKVSVVQLVELLASWSPPTDENNDSQYLRTSEPLKSFSEYLSAAHFDLSVKDSNPALQLHYRLQLDVEAKASGPRPTFVKDLAAFVVYHGTEEKVNPPAIIKHQEELTAPSRPHLYYYSSYMLSSETTVCVRSI